MKKTQETFMEQIAKISAETATLATIEYLEKARKEEQQNKQDRRLRNTKMLLRNYRSFKMHAQDIRMDLASDKFMEVMDELEQEDLAVESIKRSKERTLAMVRFIDQMLVVYKLICEQSEKIEDRRKYETIGHLYIFDEKKTYEEVAECQCTNVRTVYRDVSEAVKTLSVLVFGVDGIRLIS